MASQDSVVTAHHPYPEFTWLYKLNSGDGNWATIDGYTPASVDPDGVVAGQSTIRVEDPTEAQEAQLICVIAKPDSVNPADPDAADVATSDIIYVSVGALGWTTDLTPNVTEVVQGFTTTATFTSETDADATFGWEWRVAGGNFAPLSTGGSYFAHTLSATQPQITTLTIDNAYTPAGTPWEFRVTATDVGGPTTQTHTLHVVAGTGTPPSTAELLFASDFENMAEFDGNALNQQIIAPWTANPDAVPAGFHAAKSNQFYMNRGGPPEDDNVQYVESVLQILDKNNAMVPTRNGNHKCLVQWRYCEETTQGQWGGDGILSWHAPNTEGYSELYVEFLVRFSDEMQDTYYARGPGQDASYGSPGNSLGFGSSKFFRILNWAGSEDDYYSFFADQNSPKCLWDGTGSTLGSGFRNTLGLYARGPNNYNDPPAPEGEPNYPQTWPNSSSLNSSGERAMSYASSPGYPNDVPTQGQAVGGGLPQVEDKLNGGYMDYSLSNPDAAEIDQIFSNSQSGSANKWTKMGFRVKMNSAPGVRDGTYEQWIEDKTTEPPTMQRMIVCTDIEWCRTTMIPNEGDDPIPATLNKWNIVAFGGNHYAAQYPPPYVSHGGPVDGGGFITETHKEWLAFDEIKIYSTVPDPSMTDID